jgi:DNA processing protein
VTAPVVDQPHSAVSDAERLARMRLALSDNVGPATWHQLMDLYGNALDALARLPELAARVGGGRRIRLYDEARAHRDLEVAASLGGSLITFGESRYPAMLTQSGQPPPILFAAGNLDCLSAPCCGIVGSRNASANGRRFAREVASALGSHGWMVASGLARGIDTAAHEASLQTGTIAVMATGLDVIYPAENERLAGLIRQNGCIVTEMPPGTGPKPELFPRRNRIISGLSCAVVVVEAAIRSGSLITARIANDMGRDVFAMPGSPYDPRSSGTNKLIQDGATLLTGPQDMIHLLGGTQSSLRFGWAEPAASHSPVLRPVSSGAGFAADGAREAIISLMGPDPVEVDELIRQSRLAMREVQQVLLELDLAGRLERHAGQRVSLI